ncbi:MAG: hypothetical protein GY719_25000 [bacterium]|nr:hypothetical protein [bacterium]
MDAESRLFLVSHLLRRSERRPKALEVFEHFLRTPPEAIAAARVAAAVAELRRLSAPRLEPGTDLVSSRTWNGTVSRVRPDLGWPRAHIGRIDAFEGRWGSAAAQLAAACELEPRDTASRRLCAYALHRDRRHTQALAHLDRLSGESTRQADLVLRGHVLRALDRPTEACSAFERAAKMGRLRPSDDLAYVECLLREGRLEEARSVLDSIGGRRGAKWELAAAALDQASGRPDDAVGRLTSIRRAGTLRPQVTKRLLAAMAELPPGSETLSVLEALPADARDDRFWTLRGNALWEIGDGGEALASWERVSCPAAPLERAISAGAALWLADRYNAGRDAEVLSTVGRPAVALAAPAAVIPLVAAALARRIAEDPLDSRAARHQIATLDGVERKLSAFVDSPQAQLLRGLLLAAAGEPEEASIILRSLEASSALPREGRLQLTRCVLLSGDPRVAATALGEIVDPGPRAERLGATRSALAGDWERACRALARDPRRGEFGGGEEGGYLPALLYLAGRDAELEGLAGGGNSVRYYLAAARLRGGSPGAADRLSQEIGHVAEAPPRFRRLLAWARFRKFRERLSGGEREAARKALAASFAAWDGDEGPANWLGGKLDFALPSLLAAGRRDSVWRLLEAEARRKGPAQAASCHRLGLFHLAEGARAFHDGETVTAIEHWERAIGNLCVALANFTYIQSWVERRRITYRAKIEAEDVVGVDQGALQFLEGFLLRWSEACGERGTGAGATRTADLAISLRAERTAAQVLRDLGGFEHPKSGRSVSAGPTYLAHAGLAGPFGTWVAGLEVKRSRRPDFDLASNPLEMILKLAETMAQTEAEGAIEPETKEKLEHLFSSLRYAAVLAGEGQLERALGRLQTPEPRCFPVSESRHCGGRLRRACGEQPAHFERCNPAFAAPGGSERFARAAAELEISLLVRLGELAVASAEDRLDEGVDWWRKALETADGVGTRESVAERIRELLRGRIKVLERRDARDDGIRLLEATRRVVEDAFLLGKLASYYAARGIQAVNERKAWAKGLKDLRRANRLNPTSTHTNLNLIMALRGRAGKLSERGKADDARKLLDEARERAQNQLAEEPHNPKLQQLARELRFESSMMQLGEATSPEDLLATLLGTGPSRAMESARYHNRGVKKAEQGDLGAAIRDLEKALELEPRSPETRMMLTGVLNQHGVQLANAERFGEALRHLRRGLEIDPSSDPLQRDLQGVTQAQKMHRLLSGEGLPGDLGKILEMLRKDD